MFLLKSGRFLNKVKLNDGTEMFSAFHSSIAAHKTQQEEALCMPRRVKKRGKNTRLVRGLREMRTFKKKKRRRLFTLVL